MAKVKFNTRQVMAGFGVSDMTIFNWRKGSEQREALPHHVEGTRVHFLESEMKAWGKKHKLPFDSIAAAGAETATPKPGPKPPAKKAAAPAKKAVVKKAAAPVKKSSPRRAPASSQAAATAA